MIPNRFLGRQLQLNDVAEAVQGMLYRARTGRKPDGGRAVKVIWVHGFGGMGKSWFLHRSRLQAGTDVRSLIIDWDSPVWRYPLMGEPRSATDLFEVIACRLVQTCGEAAADAYWSAQQAVRAHGELHRRLRDDFDSQLALAAGPDRVSSPMLRLLENEGLWVDDQPRRAANIEAWRRNHDRYESSFVSWCRETARDADPAAIEPNRFLAEGLRASLRRAALEKPLLLLLDTGEVLSQELDGWLRRLLVPLCHDESPLLVLIGSRLLPDVALPGGSRQGWQAELPRERLRTIPFDELVRFSVEEIESALGALAPSVEGDQAIIAEQLHRITRGVPLAVRALLDDLQDGGRSDSVIKQLAEEDDDEPLDEGEAVRKVVARVAQRMLYHLDQDRKRERADDLRDIIVLAVLQRAHEQILKHLWPGRRVRDRLRDLGARYALLSGGDLHATVRDYLRRYWRVESQRPDIFDDVLSDVQAAIDALPPVREEQGSPEAIAREIQRLNLRTWQEGDAAVDALARSLAISAAHVEGTEDIEALLRELPLEGNSLLEARRVWKKPDEHFPDEERVIVWLQSVSDRSKTWSTREQACLSLIEGVTFLEWPMTPAHALRVFASLNRAFDFFGPDQLPQRAQMGEAFVGTGLAFHPHWSKGQQWLVEAERAFLCAIQLGILEKECLNFLGSIYALDPRRYAESEQAFRRAIDLDPAFAAAYNSIGDLYQHRLERYAESEQYYKKAIELDPKFAVPWNGLGDLYHFRLERYCGIGAGVQKGDRT